MAATIIQHKHEKGWHVRINITGLQSYEYGPFHARKNAVAFYENVLEALDYHLMLEIRCLSENVQVSEVQVHKTGPVVGMGTAEPDVMKAMKRAATTIAEIDAEAAAGVERWHEEDRKREADSIEAEVDRIMEGFKRETLLGSVPATQPTGNA